MLDRNEIMSLILEIVQIEMNNRTEEIKNNLMSVVRKSNSNEEAFAEAVLQSVKLSTVYSVKTIFEMLHELGLIDLTSQQCENLDLAKNRLRSASHLKILNNQNGD